MSDIKKSCHNCYNMLDWWSPNDDRLKCDYSGEIIEDPDTPCKNWDPNDATELEMLRKENKILKARAEGAELQAQALNEQISELQATDRPIRTLYEIIESTKDGNQPNYAECYWAMLAFNTLLNMDHRRLREVLLSEKPIPEFVRKLQADNSFNAYKGALNKSPKEWLGPQHDPASHEFQRIRKISNGLFEKALKATAKKQEGV
ncbi:MAG: hypothetical protein E6713_02870 [Sporomusaceae bacterium]|nr:hypothetical protein [Sporomusaceae bacterium]